MRCGGGFGGGEVVVANVCGAGGVGGGSDDSGRVEQRVFETNKLVHCDQDK